MKKILFVLAVILIPLWIFGDPPVYFAKDIHGQVVDTETGQVLKNVIVVARWQVHSIGFGHSGYGGALNTIEVMTDKEGNYRIPGWGPRLRWPFTYLDSRDPEIRFFRTEYYPAGVEDALHSYENRNTSMVRTSEWDGKVVKLKPFKGNWSDYGSKLRGTWDEHVCLRSCPHLVLALDAESKRIKALAPKEPFIPQVLDIDNFSEGDRKFLKKFKDEK